MRLKKHQGYEDKKDMRINSNTKDKRIKTRQGFEDKKNIKDMRKKETPRI